ncbi:MAG: nicotinate-nucleotide adenylyltransferase [Clostridia bacterium]|nr:nicotinate-nucleotide adenylyltransferase [Clostridia bacterium]
MRIGIFGGTFNPPHNGHKKLALEIPGRLSLDLLIIIPTHIPPHKKAESLASDEDRLNMCRLCFDEKNNVVSGIELRRSGKSYTVDTLSEIKKLYPDDELFFIMGSDMLTSFHSWREPEKILDMANICAVSRRAGETEKLKSYIDAQFAHRKERFTVVEFEPVEISSTEIRENSRFDMLPENVAAYIKERGLYT